MVLQKTNAFYSCFFSLAVISLYIIKIQTNFMGVSKEKVPSFTLNPISAFKILFVIDQPKNLESLEKPMH